VRSGPSSLAETARGGRPIFSPGRGGESEAAARGRRGGASGAEGWTRGESCRWGGGVAGSPIRAEWLAASNQVHGSRVDAKGSRERLQSVLQSEAW